MAFSGRQDWIVRWSPAAVRIPCCRRPQTDGRPYPWSGKGLLIGHAEAVDEAVKRLSIDTPLGDLGSMALDREAHGQFWAAASSKVAAQQATTGVKRLWLSALLGTRLVNDTAFEFNAAPDVNAIQPWLSTLGT